jgi:TrpR-related protein YerC/YecD
MKSRSEKNQLLDNLCAALLSLKNADEATSFLKDLCTPQELQVLAERWNVCCLLATGDYSYRDIHAQTGVSLATIGRVARFLNDEPHGGYQSVLNRMNKKK